MSSPGSGEIACISKKRTLSIDMRRICICGPTANNTTTSMAPRHKLPPIVESITLWPQSLDTFKHTLHGVSVIAH